MLTCIHEAKLKCILLTTVHNVDLTFIRAILLRLISPLPNPQLVSVLSMTILSMNQGGFLEPVFLFSPLF